MKVIKRLAVLASKIDQAGFVEQANELDRLASNIVFQIKTGRSVKAFDVDDQLVIEFVNRYARDGQTPEETLLSAIRHGLRGLYASLDLNKDYSFEELFNMIRERIKGTPVSKKLQRSI